MSSYYLQQLKDLVNALDSHSIKNDYYLSQINQCLLNLSHGISTTESQRGQIRHILNELNHKRFQIESSYNGILFNAIRKVQDKMTQDIRRNVAETFYSKHNCSLETIDYINFNYEVVSRRIASGTTLYQWCFPCVKKEKNSLKTRDGYYIYIGSFYSINQVDAEALGASSIVDCMVGNTFLGHVPRDLYQFTLPFEAECLDSVAARGIDTWSARYDNDGSTLSGGMGVQVKGGARQIFMPLSRVEKEMLAKIGIKIE